MAIIGDPKTPLGVKALEAMGLPTKGCTGLELRFLPNSIVTAVATYAPDAESVEKVIKVIEAAEKV